MEHEVAQRNFLMQVAAAFGALALFLAILGTYGLLAYEVSLREKEIGIRLALGSSRQAIVQLLLGQESRWVLIGAAAGLFGAILSGYALRAQFYHARAASFPVLAGSLCCSSSPRSSRSHCPPAAPPSSTPSRRCAPLPKRRVRSGNCTLKKYFLQTMSRILRVLRHTYERAPTRSRKSKGDANEIHFADVQAQTALTRIKPGPKRKGRCIWRPSRGSRKN